MKVEYVDSDIYGKALIISASEFLKAQENEEEFQSLVYAIEAYAAWCESDYELTAGHYNSIASWLDKNGAVIVVSYEENHHSPRRCEVLVSNDNQPKRVVFYETGEYHAYFHGKLNRKALRQRHNQIEGSIDE